MFRQRLFCVLISMFIFLSISQAEAAWIGERSLSPVRYEVLEAKDEYTRIRFEFLGFDSQSKVLDGQPYAEIKIPGLTNWDQKGLPALPKWSRNIAVPEGARVNLVVESQRLESFKSDEIIPSKGPIERDTNPESVPYFFSNFYSAGNVFPANFTSISESFQLRDLHGINIRINPLQYDRVSGELRMLREMVVRIEHKPRAGSSILNVQKMDVDFQQIYQERFLNFSSLRKRNKVNHIIPDTGRVLVISHENFVQGVTPLMNWRRDTGVWHKQVSLAELRGRSGDVDYQQIKALIQSEYDANQISYVLLVGDKEFLPTHPGMHGNAWGEEADPMYGLVAGSDSYPDLVVSRLSVKSETELATIVQKILRYEREPELNGAWYSRATGVASEEGMPRDWERANILRDLLLGWHYNRVDQIYEPNDFKPLLVDALNEGTGFINYLGHGSENSWVSTDFTNTDILNLENGNRVPVIVSVACVNGDFGYADDVFAEVWLKAGTPAESKGAVAVFASSTNQSWVPPTVGQLEITRLLVNEQMRTVGSLMFHGSVAVLEDGSSSAEQTFETWHIFGDGTTEIRTRAPQAISVEEQNIAIDLSQRSLQVDLGEAGIRAGVVLGDQLIGSGISNEHGNLSLSFNRELSRGDMLRVTFSGFNRIPEVREITVR